LSLAIFSLKVELLLMEDFFLALSKLPGFEISNFKVL